MRALVLLVALVGCGDEPSFSIPVGGGFSVDVEASERLVIASHDGRVLLDGLPPAPVGDGAPLTGFAVRDMVTRYEMQFGSFKPSDHASGPWRGVSELKASGNELSLRDEEGAVLARLTFSTPSPGHLVVSTAKGDGPDKRLSWGFACDGGDHFIGFGAQSWDVDHRGQTVPTFVQEGGIGKSENDDYGDLLWYAQGKRHSSHLPIPMYLARRGYALSTETPYRSIFALCSERSDVARIEVELGTVFHIFDGPSPAEAIERASAEHGRPRMPPRVAFAPWFDAIFGSDEVRRVAQKLRDEAIPASVIWSEDWRGGTFTGDKYELDEEWEVSRDVYPDFEEVAADLHALGFDFHVYFNPFVYEGSKAFSEVQPEGWLVKTADGADYLFTGAKFESTGLLDVFHPGARAWAVEKMRDAIALGADGWMHDFAEWMPTDGVSFAGSGHELHNEYAVEWQRIAREAIDGVDDGHERVMFGRSGWFGTPALADVIWAGDQRTTFDADDGLPTILPMGIGLGIVGISTYGHDIAGYQAATNEGSTKELYFRWVELGAWSPVMRTHHGLQPAKNWNWEKDAETIAHVKRYAELHVALLPLFEGLAAHASTTGMPIWRGLPLAFSDDPAVWPITDQVMVGEHILLAPIVAPQNGRALYLPDGSWYPWDGGAPREGGVQIEVEAPIDTIPAFVRAGGVVPMLPPGAQTLVRASASVPGPEILGDDRRLRIYLGADGRFDEQGGLSYSLTSEEIDPGALSASFEGQALSACGEPPCLEGDIARVTGPGTLSIAIDDSDVATLVIEGGAADRALTIEIFRP